MSDGYALGYGLAAGFTTIIVIAVAHWLLTAIITAIVADSKGRNGIGWFILGLLLGFVGLITVLLLSRTAENEARRNIEVQQRQAEIEAEMLRQKVTAAPRQGAPTTRD